MYSLYIKKKKQKTCATAILSNQQTEWLYGKKILFFLLIKNIKEMKVYACTPKHLKRILKKMNISYQYVLHLPFFIFMCNKEFI